ncbi:MAG: VanZ family protein [Anaerorhabdus sp.]|uniref:VanZ family protein n=1 Tax=Anaerorhabdus sp. TaxID=1872524 RepID=UPI003A863EA8
MKKKVFQFIPWIFVGIMIIFIFANSLIPAVGSKQISSTFTTFVHNLLLSLNVHLDYEFLHHLIRKFAHFLEYAILGGLIHIAIQLKPLAKSSTTNFICFLIVPIIDESLQLITPGRSCELGDMIIDGSGMIVGFLLIWLIVKCLAKSKATH